MAGDIQVLYVDAAGNETDVTANCTIAFNAVAPGSQWAIGGTVTYNPGGVPIPAGSKLVILRELPLVQGTVFANQGGNFPAVTEQTSDLLDMMIQQLQEQLQRVPMLSIGKDQSLYTLALNPVAGQMIGWDATAKILTTFAAPGAIAFPLSSVNVSFSQIALAAANQAVRNMSVKESETAFAITDALNAGGTQVAAVVGRDNVTGIQACIDAGAKTLRLPNNKGVSYEISNTLKYGSFVINGANDVTSAIPNYGFKLLGEGRSNNAVAGAALKWTGANNPGTTKQIINDSVGPYTIVTDSAPMIAIVAGSCSTIKDLVLDGNNKAYACLTMEEQCEQITLENLTTFNATIGFRHGKYYNYKDGTADYGYGGSPYYQAHVNPWIAAGGYQQNNLMANNCYFGANAVGCTIESGQNVATIHTSCEYNAPVYGMIINGGLMTLNAPAFLGNATATADIWMPSGTNTLTINDMHSESGATWQLQTSTNPVAQSVIVNRADTFKVNVAGGGIVGEFNNITNFQLTRADVNARADIVVTKSHVTNVTVANTGARSNFNILLVNCTIDAGVLTALKAITDGYVTIIGPDGIWTNSPIVNAPQAVAYSAAMTIDASKGNDFTITDTDGVAYTVNAPTNPLPGQRIFVTIRNTSGGAPGAATWNAVFKMVAWVNPANGFSRSIHFRYDGANWIEIGRTAADVPN